MKLKLTLSYTSSQTLTQFFESNNFSQHTEKTDIPEMHSFKCHINNKLLKFKLAVDVRQDGVLYVFLCSVSANKRNR